MPKLSLEEPWPRSGSRSKVDSVVISCETLSKVDWYSRRPHKAQLHYYSDGDEEGDGEGKPASEADDEHEGAHMKAAAQDHEHHEEAYEEGTSLDVRNSYGGGTSFEQGLPFLPFPPQSVYEKPFIAISSPGRDAKKSERAPRTYPGTVPHSSNLLPHSGNLLPHSGILLPNYMNIHHAGSHNSGTHAHNKGHASIKSAHLIPAQLAGKSSKGRKAFNDAIEPSSPKVNCLGRVKIKHKCHRETEKLADIQTSANRRDTVQPSSKEGLNKILDRGPPLNGEGAMAGVLSSAPPTAELKKSKHGRDLHREVLTIRDPGFDSEPKVKRGIRKTLKEAKSHIKLHRERKKAHPLNASMASDYAASHVEIAVDLGRFRAMDSMQGEELRVSRMENGNHEIYEAEFVTQVPPPNSLLLMRNSGNRAACTTLNSSFSTRTVEDSQEYGVSVDGEADARRQAYLSLLKGGSSKHGASSLLDVKLGELEVTATKNEFDGQGTYFSDFDMERLCAVVVDECKPWHGKKNAMVRRQASLPKATPLESRLWQRRCILKPSDLDVGRPIAGTG